MALSDEILSSRFGDVKIRVVKCDTCGKPESSDSSYSPNPGWLKIHARDGDREYSRTETDFCSVDCMVRHFVPDIYSTDPIAVMNAIEDLKKIETSLGRATHSHI